ALYRPGPLGGGMVDAYINRKHGREKPEYAHPVMEEILRETYGVMVYQEQIMRILNRLGGIELSSAYACIKAISKKKYDIIDQRRVEFVKGAQERGLAKGTAEDIFALIVKFGGYGFNKSHTAAYAYVGYQTAYLKAHFRPEFMAALLSSEIEDGNKRDVMVEHIADAKRLGVEVLPPNVNASDSDFTVQDGKIVFGLTAIKGCGRGATDDIVRARREGGRFKDLFDFCERIDLRAVQKAAAERLIKAGALDCFGGHRAQLTHNLPRAIQAATERQNDKRLGQRNLFDAEPTAAAPATNGEALPDVPPWPETEKLKYEKEVLDFYLSSHPLAQREKEIRRYATYAVAQLKTLPAEQEVTLGGMLTQVRYMTYKRPRKDHNRYGRCKVEDFTGAVECVLWGEEFSRYKDAFVEDAVVLVRGTLEKKTDEPILVLSRVLTLEQAQRELARELHLLVKVGQHGPLEIDQLADLLRRTPGPCPVVVTVKDLAGRRCVLKLGRDCAVNPATYPRDELEAMLGEGSVRLM
ncbi:MAG TPA: OB-fold nucleic acid binding domain-containing protein, partial [Gemmataceae bacterium]|nr:OB-fold nucleic acid binding domain-containing protein [Gemmataceae bacterium]